MRKDIFVALGQPPRGIFVANVSITLWGARCVIDCLYDPDAPKPFTLTFTNCTSILWTMHGDEPDLLRDEVADVIGIDFEDDKKDTVIHTSVVEIAIKCADPASIKWR